MNVWRWSGVLVLVGLLGLVGARYPVFAQDKDEKLEWKAFDAKGKTFYQELETKTTQDMKVMGQEIRQTQNQTFYISWTPLEKDKDGNYVVEQQIVGVKMEIDIGGNKITYDSTIEQPKNPMTDFFEALTKTKLKLTIDPKTMKVTNIEGRDDFVKKLGGTNPQMEPLLKSILSTDALKQMAEPTWGALPDKAVKKGDSWNRKSSLDLGPIGTYETKFDYTYDGQDGKDKLDKIKIKPSLTYSAPVKSEGLPFKIKEAKLASTEGSGDATFSREKGRFESSTMKLKLEGHLTIDVAGMETKVDLTQNQTTSYKTTDTNPVPEKKTPAK